MRTSNTGQKDWETFLNKNQPAIAGFENLHALAREFLVSGGYPLDQFAVYVVKNGRSNRSEGHFTVTITPIPKYPSFTAEYDNSWNPV